MAPLCAFHCNRRSRTSCAWSGQGVFPLARLWPRRASAPAALGHACPIYLGTGEGASPLPWPWPGHAFVGPGLGTLCFLWPGLAGARGYLSFSHAAESKSLKMIMESLQGSSCPGENFRVQRDAAPQRRPSRLPPGRFDRRAPEKEKRRRSTLPSWTLRW